MVLQRDRPVVVWGRAAPGEAVEVAFGESRVTGTGDGSGRFRVELPAQPASALPRTLTVKASNTVEIADVLVGEVWVCSGQSNMEWAVADSKDAAQEIARATDSLIRWIKAPHRLTNEPQETVDARWIVCSPESAGACTAVGYYFARALRAELDVPVGLLDLSWGGSRAEPWTPPEDLASHPRYAGMMEALEREIAAYRATPQATLLARHQEALAAYAPTLRRWWTAVSAAERGVAESWQDPALDDASWARMEAPGEWGSVEELRAFDGFVWMRRALEVPAAWAGRALVLELGAIDDADCTFWNGRELGVTLGHTTPRRYRIPGDQVGAGRQGIAVQVLDTGGGGGLTGPQPALRVYPEGQEEQALSLSGSWRYRVGGPMRAGNTPPAPPAPPEEPGQTYTSPGAMYHAMVAPFVPFGMRGALWYQGESNAAEAEAYRELLPLMIQGWRRVWQDELHFGIVQLASFLDPAPEQPVEGGWAFLRDAQLHTARSVPRTGLVVTTDIGDARDIHPRNKQEVGRRLALWALATVYGQDWQPYSGPLYRSLERRGSALRLHFEHADGLHTSDGQEPRGFAVAGADGRFVWAQARLDGDCVVVESPDVPEPVAVRYGWCNNAAHTNLVNAAGLPASPFRSD